MLRAPLPQLALLGILATSRFGVVSASGNLLRRSLGSSEDANPVKQEVPSGLEDEPPLELPEEGSLIAMQFSPDPYATRDHLEMILNGELFLSGIRYGPFSFRNDEVTTSNDDWRSDAYDVDGDFCVFDPSLNKSDPAKYPTVQDVAGESLHCGEHRYTMPLAEVARAVRKHDASSKSNLVKSLPVSGLLFHEGYSGAGLLSNALTTFDSTLVISEHDALSEALAACDTLKNRYQVDNCSSVKQQQLVRDIVTLLSRTSETHMENVRNVDKLYLKLQGASAAYLPILRALYPSAPWVFVYRNAEHALAKHMDRKRSKACIKKRRNPSSALSSKSEENEVDLETITHHEVCALHLASLLGVAFHEHEESHTGMLLSYDEHVKGNVDGFVDIILPYLGLQNEIDADPAAVRERVEGILSVRSNTSTRLNPEDHVWNGETIEVSEEVENAVKVFMSQEMESIARSRM